MSGDQLEEQKKNWKPENKIKILSREILYKLGFDVIMLHQFWLIKHNSLSNLVYIVKLEFVFEFRKP